MGAYHLPERCTCRENSNIENKYYSARSVPTWYARKKWVLVKISRKKLLFHFANDRSEPASSGLGKVPLKFDKYVQSNGDE